jgi:fatty acid desaturase
MREKDLLFEPLIENATEYAKTTYELIKLKILDKSSDVVSSIIPHSIVFVMFASFVVFLNLGLALWLGEILGGVFLGFLSVAAFYGIAGIAIHFVFHKRIKRYICNYIIKEVLK